MQTANDGRPQAMIAMSGGVDSSVAAYLMQQAGYDCMGVTMKLYENEDAGVPRGHTCCALDDVEDARRVAYALGMPYYVFNYKDAFREQVMARFAAAYQRGATPNPCLDCNRYLKFGLLETRARALGCEVLATGHYARIVKDEASGRYVLKKALDGSKDQSYVLYSLTQAQLSRVLLPMGGMTKEAAREKAEALGLTVAHKHDSQDICFVPDGDYMRFLTEHGVRPQPGHFIGLDGRDFGPHCGQEAYTLGQRRGLDIPYGTRIYVVAKRGSDVVIGPNEALFSRRVQVRDLNWIPFDVPPEGLRAQAKLRYTPKTAECTVHLTENGAELCFDEPQRAVTPGQAAVLYDGDTVLGGGTICGAD